MKRPKWKSTLAWKKIGPYFMIVDEIDKKQIHRLNDSAAFIWEFCNGDNTHEDMAKRLTCEYDIEPEKALRDVNKLIISFIFKGLIDER